MSISIQSLIDTSFMIIFPSH